MENNEVKKKNRSGKKSFERFKEKCKQRKQERQKQQKIDRIARDEQKRIIAEKKKAKYNRMIARMHVEMEKKEFVWLQKKAERKSLKQIEMEKKEIEEILANERNLFDEARASAKKRHEASEELKRKDRIYKASLANRQAYIKAKNFDEQIQREITSTMPNQQPEQTLATDGFKIPKISRAVGQTITNHLN